MTTIIMTLDSKSPLIANPNSEEAKLQNLMLNIMGGLQFEDLEQDEKDLLIKHGYEE